MKNLQRGLTSLSLVCILLMGGCAPMNPSSKRVGGTSPGALCNPTTGYVFCPLKKRCARLWEDKECADYCKAQKMKDCDDGQAWCKAHPKACTALGKSKK